MTFVLYILLTILSQARLCNMKLLSHFHLWPSGGIPDFFQHSCENFQDPPGGVKFLVILKPCAEFFFPVVRSLKNGSLGGN